MKKGTKYVVLILLILGFITLVFIWFSRDVFTGEIWDPNREYVLKYYRVSNHFKMDVSMPGGSSCESMRVFLYDKEGNQLNSLLTTNCDLVMQPHWLGDKLFVGDGVTLWFLPKKNKGR